MTEKDYIDNSLAKIKDIRGTVYPNLASALNDSLLVREVGVTVKVMTSEGVVEYWFKNGVQDSNLIQKVTNSSIVLVTKQKIVLVNDISFPIVLDLTGYMQNIVFVFVNGMKIPRTLYSTVGLNLSIQDFRSAILHQTNDLTIEIVGESN